MYRPRIVEEWETIRTILRERASIGRYGDGEFKLCFGKKQISQLPNPLLQQKLRAVLKSQDPKFLVGIPRIWGRSDLQVYDPHKWAWWQGYARSPTIDLFDPKKLYYSSFITRPDSAIHIECEDYWKMCQGLWKKRRVLVVCGAQGALNKMGKAMDPSRGFLAGATEVQWVLGPHTNAFSMYDDILAKVDKYGRDFLVILSLGPTATVMAYDIFKMGFQALDIGHMPMFFAREHPNSPPNKITEYAYQKLLDMSKEAQGPEEPNVPNQ